MGNVKLRPSNINVSRQKFDISIKTEHSVLIL